MLIPIEVSARHLHLSLTHLQLLFGDHYQLKPLSQLRQLGEFAATDTVYLLGPKGRLPARIIGPTRDHTQVELSLSDCRYLGLQAPLRLSGDLVASGSIILSGPRGQCLLDSGLIIAQRHLHLDPITADKLRLQNNQLVSVRIPGPRGGLLEQIVVRIKDSFQISLHLDTDEANALGINPNNCQGELII